jgi:hypothetical protein
MDDLLPPEHIAVLALMYRTCDRQHHTAKICHLEDIEADPGEVSMATLQAGQQFGDLDWLIVEVLIEHPSRAADLAELLSHAGHRTRAEAVLHATTSYVGSDWAKPYIHKRWWKVEREVKRLIYEGFTASRDEVEEVAIAAFKQITGRSYEDYMDEFEPELQADVVA